MNAWVAVGPKTTEKAGWEGAVVAESVILFFKLQITDAGIALSALILLTAGSWLSGGNFDYHPPHTSTC